MAQRGISVIHAMKRFTGTGVVGGFGLEGGIDLSERKYRYEQQGENKKYLSHGLIKKMPIPCGTDARNAHTTFQNSNASSTRIQLRERTSRVLRKEARSQRKENHQLALKSFLLKRFTIFTGWVTDGPYRQN